MMRADVITFGCLVCFLPVYAVREAWVGYRHERKLSQIARDVGWWFTAFVYFWSAMPIHWWVPSPFHASVATTVIFWTIQGLLLVWNVATWKHCALPSAQWPRWLRIVNFPLWYVILGPLAAWTLFPQNQVWPW